eukprot:CAMPEP_0184739744 /NCGR_PEP_ID=MMETSP0315-20130426/2693_1 /TAXON_ID=101924 /ORGANISM="Rhodosorus marinus, Strain UTEX LB 2760" /LENGTH=56 /DNA_ID=CAMNT_0027208889 /DNA_START=177 /DNA_END=344 /DNA_ORIENTATION=+
MGNIADALSRHAVQQMVESTITTDVDWSQAYVEDPEFAEVYQSPELLKGYHTEPTG